MPRGKLLIDLLGEWLAQPRSSGVEISGLSSDSRTVRPGDLFLAYPGSAHDGRMHIEEAVAKGAVAVAYDPANFAAPQVAVSVPVPDLQHKVGFIADRFFDAPSRQLFIVGITGTNGKTSCAFLLAQAFNRLGLRCALIGTLGSGYLDALDPGAHTTPGAIALHQTLREFCDAGATHVCLEVSSHALHQGRVAGVEIDVAVFTNLSRDHLDYHQHLEHYAEAKARLFQLPELKVAVINRDDRFGRELIARLAIRCVTFGELDADFVAHLVVAEPVGLRLGIRSIVGDISARTKLIGRINVPNLLAVAAVLYCCDQDPSRIAEALQDLGPVPGRMELFSGSAALPKVVVDYAHTPDALERALRSIRDHCAGKLWCVFGCGGDRDRGKRPMMGEIAELTADEVVVTDDNPRFEDPADIVAAIQSGMRRRPHVIHDRKSAIEWAIQQAEPQDWVLIAGKGHETTQQVRDRTVPLDDRQVVSECLRQAA